MAEDKKKEPEKAEEEDYMKKKFKGMKLIEKKEPVKK